MIQLLRTCLLFVVFNISVVQAGKVALVTGVTGQDGSYLAEILLDKGYIVHGLVRDGVRVSNHAFCYLMHCKRLKDRFFVHTADLTDTNAISKVLEQVQPDEIYNLGAQSDVGKSFVYPLQTCDATGLGALRILEANRLLGGKAKVYQASSSELFGSAHPPQCENTPFQPRSPYAAAKLFGFWMGVNYREAYGMFVSNGILFNHESPRRKETFLTRKITKGLASILTGSCSHLQVGNLNAKRDWGFAPDYVECMWRILQEEKPDDYVIGTGVQHTVRDFITEAFRYSGISIDWQGEGINEVGVVKNVVKRWEGKIFPGQALIQVNPALFRPTDVHSTRANPAKAFQVLHWVPQTSFLELIRIMVDVDFLEANLEPIGEGISILKQRYPRLYVP